MIKAVILDVDGVIVGGKPGVNFPYPSDKVITALKKLNASGVPVALMTSKSHFGTMKIIEDAELGSSIHITDGGSVIIDWSNGTIDAHRTIDKAVVGKALQKLLGETIYTEVYTTQAWHVQSNLDGEMHKVHAEILQKQPEVVRDLKSFVEELPVTKIIASPSPEHEALQKEMIEILDPELKVSWSSHPAFGQRKLAIITPKAVSKRSGAERISEHLSIELNDFLGVGDNLSDWQFMEFCGYTATVANGSDELKKLVGEANGFLGPSVDDNGILDIFEHFNLL
ncbi:MAG: HAD family hydrolase [Candidatus Dojkabacteria bacterium]